jgi:Putative transposase
MQPVAISNRRLVAADGSVSFRWKDYRIEGPGRWKTMAIAPTSLSAGS